MVTSDKDTSEMRTHIERRIAALVDAKGQNDLTLWIGGVLSENAHLRQQVTTLQADNTRLHLRAEAALNREHNLMREVDCLRDVLGQGDGSKVTITQRDEAILKARIAEQGYESARAVLADVTKERDEARALNGEMAAKLDRAKGDSEAASRTIGDLTRERDRERVIGPVLRIWVDRARAELSASKSESVVEAGRRVARERDEARGEAQALQQRLDKTLATTFLLDVPPELARLYKAAKRMLAHAGDIDQRIKLAEECGEYVAEELRRGDRFSVAKVNHEIHDVLTVALSLCEPALMVKAAERLEARLPT